MGPHGLFEHALYRQPRVEHGYCTDDNARALVITAGVEGPDAEYVFRRCLEFVAAGWTPRGWRNRMSADGEWTDELGSEDCHGRALWGLGVAARHGRLPAELLPAFDQGLQRRLIAPRAIAYSLLGAVAALESADAEEPARRGIALLTRGLPPVRPGAWMWPEQRLTYDNARIPQAMMLVGEATDDLILRTVGLELLDWLVKVEWRGDHFSFTPTAGRGQGDESPGFDQQPIEAWAMAEACETAAHLTGDSLWVERAQAAVDWFDGRNDVGVALYDPETGAGHDGLEPDGVNLNCGAESTLAALAAQAVGARLAEWRSAVSS